MQFDSSKFGRRFWALADQGVVSAGNFFTGLILVRNLPAREYGIYGLLFGAILSVNTLHAALVTYPLSVRGAPMSEADLRRWSSGAVIFSMLLAVVLIGLIWVAAFATGRPGLTPFVGMAMLFWQLQETARTAFFAHFRQREALLGDGLSYLGQAALLLALSLRAAITPESAFLVIGATSAAAFLVQAIQLRLSFSGIGVLRSFIQTARSLGAWGVPSRIVTLFTFQAFPWTLFFSYGASAAAVFQALASAVALSNPVVISTSNLITATVASTTDKRRFSAALGHAYHGWAIIAPFFCFVLVFPGITLRLLYGAHSEYLAYPNALRFMVIACALEALAVVASAVIGGVSDTRALFMMQGAAMIVALLCGLPLAASGGILLAVVGYVVVQTARVVYGVRVCSKLWPRNWELSGQDRSGPNSSGA